MAEGVKLTKLRRFEKKAKKGDGKTPAGKRRKSAKARVFATEFLSMPVLTEMMRWPQTAPPLRSATPLLEAGVLAFRRKKKGKLLILLISKKRSKNWGIPKGKVEPTLSFPETAAKEAFEEAGVLGSISPTSVGMFRDKKRTANPEVRRIIEVWVYLLEVTETLSDWPEKGKRSTRWVSCEMAARRLREPVLAHLCHRLAQA